jgi:hypothetical protein
MFAGNPEADAAPLAIAASLAIAAPLALRKEGVIIGARPAIVACVPGVLLPHGSA